MRIRNQLVYYAYDIREGGGNTRTRVYGALINLDSRGYSASYGENDTTRIDIQSTLLSHRIVIISYKHTQCISPYIVQIYTDFEVLLCYLE